MMAMDFSGINFIYMKATGDDGRILLADDIYYDIMHTLLAGLRIDDIPVICSRILMRARGYY